MQKKKRYKLSVGVKASLVYTIASLLSKGLAFITVPIFTRLMSSSEIGVVNIYNSWYSIISVVATLSLTSGGVQLAMKEFRNERDEYLSSVLSLTSLIAIIFGIIYFLASTFWNQVFGMSMPLMILMIFHLLLFPAYDFWLMRQRYEYKYRSAGGVSIISAVLAAGVSVCAVLWASKLGIQHLGEVRLFSNYFVQLSVAFVLWIYIFCRGRTFYSRRFWRFSLALSIPLIGNSFASQILSVSDRVMIGRIIDSSAVGIYSTLYTVSSISLLIWNSINAAFVPFLFNNLEKREKRQQIRSLANGLLAIFSIIAFLMTAVAPEIVRILATKEYYEAIYIMPPIAAGVFLTSVTNLYSNVLIYYKKTKFIMISTIIAAIVNVILNYFGIQKFGYQAAAYTTLIAYVIHALIQGTISTKVHRAVTGNNSVYDTKIIFGLGAFTILSCLICIPLYSNIVIRYFVVGIITIAIFVSRNRILRLLDQTRG